jgi:hypothetical protein
MYNYDRSVTWYCTLNNLKNIYIKPYDQVIYKNLIFIIILLLFKFLFIILYIYLINQNCWCWKINKLFFILNQFIFMLTILHDLYVWTRIFKEICKFNLNANLYKDNRSENWRRTQVKLANFYNKRIICKRKI